MRKRTIISYGLVILLMLMMMPFTVFAQTDNITITPEDLLPSFNNFRWAYHGIAEYGHDMSVTSIEVAEDTLHYFIQGNVHDASGGESEVDFSLQLKYTVTAIELLQRKSEQVMMDSAFDEIQLITTPLEEGHTWQQEVEGKDSPPTTLESSIIQVQTSDRGRVYTVRHEDINSSYFEQREIQEGLGVISFEKLMENEETGESYTVGYSLFKDGTGLMPEMDFVDVSEDDWYWNHAARMVTMGLLSGYPDNTFKADNAVTVAELITLTLKTMGEHPWGDTGIWYEPYLTRAVELDLIEEGEFEDFNRPITRAEMTKVVVNALGEPLAQGSFAFSDEDAIDDEYLPYISTAVEFGLVSGYLSDNTFRPENETNRSEAASLMVSLLEHVPSPELFTVSEAIALEEEFRNRLFQETGEGWVVEDFETREDLVDYIAQIAGRDLVEAYVDDYFDQLDGEFVQRPMDGPVRFYQDRPYQLELVHPRKYTLTQETHTELAGNYTLAITYTFENQQWIMKDRDLDVH
jgi:hypothetical protein